MVLAAHGPAARFLQQVGIVDLGLPFDDPSLAWLFQDGRPTPVRYGRAIAWMTLPSAGLPERLRGEVGAAVAICPARPEPGSELHAASFLLSTLAELGITAALDDAPLPIEPLRAGEILVHPGSGSARKNWPAKRFGRVIERLREAGVPVSLVMGEADGGAVDELTKTLVGPLGRVEAPLHEVAARLAGARAYLGNDSGVSHLAGLCGARSYVLFGPTDPRLWAPLGPRVTTLPFEVSPDEVARRLIEESGNEV